MHSGRRLLRPRKPGTKARTSPLMNFGSCTSRAGPRVSGSWCGKDRGDQMTAKETIARLRERIAALTTAGFSVREAVVWRNPGETETEAIERYMRQHLDIATTPRATL